MGIGILRNNLKNVPIQHNRTLYITVKVRHVELKRVILHAGSSLNIISLNFLDDIGSPRENTQKQSFEVSIFNGDQTSTIGFVNLNLTVGQIRAPFHFYAIDSQTSYHLLLGRSWSHRYKAIPSTYPQCLKAIWKRKDIGCLSNGTKYISAYYFNELA